MPSQRRFPSAVSAARRVSSAPLLAALCSGLFVVGTTGCATTTPAPGLHEAEATLGRARTDTVARNRPERVAEARELLRKAKQADARGERERATLLARQALQTFVAAENQEGRDEATVALRAYERSEGGAPVASAAVPLASATATVAPAAPTPPTERVTFYPVFDTARSYPPAAPTATTPPAPPAPTVQGSSLRELADRTLVALQFKRSESLGLGKDQLCPQVFREFDSILELSQKRFDVGDYERSYEFSLRADERFRQCETRDAVAGAAAKKKDDTADAAKKKATAAIQKAQTELARARSVVPATEPALVQGAGLLHDAEGWLGRAAYPEAEDSATKAYAVLVKIKEAPAAKAPVDKKEKKDKQADEKVAARKTPAKEPGATGAGSDTDTEKKEPSAAPAAKQDDDKGVPAPAVVVVDTKAEKYAEQRVAAAPVEAGVDPTWKSAYPVVFRALTLRDKAKETVGSSPDDASAERLTEADKSLAAARAAWDAKSFVAAEAAAQTAIGTYERLIVEAKQGATDEARAAAEAAVREAAIAAQVCETEACDKRDPGRLAEGRALLDSAKRALGDRRFPAAKEDAERARTALDAALSVARKEAKDAALDAATRKRLAEEATDALSTAAATRKLCEQKECAKRDDEKWLRASEALRSASVAQNDERFEKARDLAREADKSMRALLGLPPGFEIPAGVTRIVKSGDQLKVLPAITFAWNGKPTAGSTASIDDLVKTLLANKVAVKRIHVVGRAYGRQSAWTQKVADGRGRGLRDALVARGVAADLVDPSGTVAPSSGDTSQQVEIRIEIELVEAEK
jgi:hypothetical protein